MKTNKFEIGNLVYFIGNDGETSHGIILGEALVEDNICTLYAVLYNNEVKVMTNEFLSKL